MSTTSDAFTSLKINVLTVSDTRDEHSDTSGKKLVELLTEAGHICREKKIIKDDIYHIRAVVAQWIFDADVQVILITGGTGFSGRDSTPEAVSPLFAKEIPGFGELFRSVSFDKIGSSTIQSRALAGLANNTVIFCVPGSTGACVTAWEKIIASQLDSRHKPCNFVGQLK